MYHKNNHNHNHNHNSKERSNQVNIFLDELTNPDGPYSKLSFDSKNLRQFTKHNIDFVKDTRATTATSTSTSTVIKDREKKNNATHIKDLNKEKFYKPFKKDSLFWCFYILKYGFSKYEMEVGNQHFPIEKQEKFSYIEQFRKTSNKDLLKMHKIKPLTLLEDDLANQERISIKTFFALCIVENINIILIDKRKIFEVLTTDDAKINVVHRNSITHDHQIELDVLPETIHMYKETYYKMPTFDVSLKSMTSYKVEELLDLCKKLDINATSGVDKKKLSKKDIYELLVQQF
jgi:hypothetical protein